MKEKIKGWRYGLNFALATLTALLLGFAVVVIAMSYRQTQAYMHPARIDPAANFLKANSIPYENIELTTEDGVKLAAWYTPSQNGAVILVAHGHGGYRQQDIYALFASHGYGVIAWDFRAHGKSGGEFTSLGQAVVCARAWGSTLGEARRQLAGCCRSYVDYAAKDGECPQQLLEVVGVVPPLQLR